MSAHRYWRIYITAVCGNVGEGLNGATGPCSIKEVELRASLGGADETGSGTASALSSDGGAPPANAFDNDTATAWGTSFLGPFPVWLKYDFGSGNDKDIVEIALRPVTQPNWCPRDFLIQYSDDDSAWTTLYTVENFCDWNASANTLFNSNYTWSGAGSKEVWRIFMTSEPAGGTVELREIGMMTSIGGSSVATGGLVFATSSGSTDPSSSSTSAAFDGTNIYWSQWEFSDTPTWIGYKFASAVDLRQITLTIDFYTERGPTDFTLDYWDGAAWVTEATFTGVTWTAQYQTQTFFLEDPRYGNPIADIAVETWLPSSGSSLAAMLSWGGDDTTYIETDWESECEILLGPIETPTVDSGFVLSYRIASANTNDILVQLKDGSTVIASTTHASVPTSLTDYDLALSDAECASITDFSDLRVTFKALS
jgi:hypothetical protein